MALNVQFTDEELPDLIKLLGRGLNCWDPRDAPKWAYTLEARAVARLNDIKAEKAKSQDKP